VAKLQNGFVEWVGKQEKGTAERGEEEGEGAKEQRTIKRPKQAVGKQGSGWRTQFRLLLERSWRQVRPRGGNRRGGRGDVWVRRCDQVQSLQAG
jgi:hypothetical protein